MKSMHTRSALVTLLLSLLAAAGCGDDASPDPPQAASGAGGSAGGAGGAGGSAGQAGSGPAGQGGQAGSDQAGSGGSAGQEAAGAAGEAGQGGGGGAPVARAWKPVDLPPSVTQPREIHGNLDAVWLVSEKSDSTGKSDVWRLQNDEWTKVYSLKVGLGVSALFAAPDGSVWLTTSGTMNKLHRYDGKSWGEVDKTSFGVTSTYAVWATSAKDVWVGTQWNFGQENLHHYDGKSWSSVDGGQDGVTAIWGDEQLIYASAQKTLLKGHESGVKAVSIGSSSYLNEIWGSSQQDVFVVSEGGFIGHYDGDKWSKQASGTKNKLFTVWGTGPDDVWAGGNSYEDSGALLHYDGQSWSDAAKENGPSKAQRIFGSMGDAWAWDNDKLFRYAPE